MDNDENEITLRMVFEFIGMIIAFLCLGIAVLALIALEIQIAGIAFAGFAIFGWLCGFHKD